MISILDKVLENTRKPEIVDGIHENIYIESVDNLPRKNAKGELSKRVCYTKFVKKDNASVVAEKEIAWFSVMASEKRKFENFYTMLMQMSDICKTLYNNDLDNNPFTINVNRILASNNIQNIEELKAIFNITQVATMMVNQIEESYVNAVSAKLGYTQAPMRIKLSYNFSGDNIVLPDENFIELMGMLCTLEITEDDIKNKERSKMPKEKINNAVSLSNI